MISVPLGKSVIEDLSALIMIFVPSFRVTMEDPSAYGVADSFAAFATVKLDELIKVMS